MSSSSSESISIRIDKSTLISIATTTIAATLAYVAIDLERKWSKEQTRRGQEAPSYDRQEDLIGNTPILRLEKLSRYVFQGTDNKNQSFHVKMECSNPNGTGKDRAACPC